MGILSNIKFIVRRSTSRQRYATFDIKFPNQNRHTRRQEYLVEIGDLIVRIESLSAFSDLRNARQVIFTIKEEKKKSCTSICTLTFPRDCTTNSGLHQRVLRNRKITESPERRNATLAVPSAMATWSSPVAKSGMRVEGGAVRERGGRFKATHCWPKPTPLKWMNIQKRARTAGNAVLVPRVTSRGNGQVKWSKSRGIFRFRPRHYVNYSYYVYVWSRPCGRASKLCQRENRGSLDKYARGWC